MKTAGSLTARLRAAIVFFVCVGCGLFSPSVRGQINSWTKSHNGNWQDVFWSLGQLPGTNQTILFTNQGSKTITIGSNTVQKFPETLNVDSITISSPAGTSNTLLVNNAGTQVPVTVQSLNVASNSSMTVNSSALRLAGPNGTTMQIGGRFNQTNSIVSGRQVNVGYIGPGIYNFDSGILSVSNLWVGGSFGGVFNQSGGTNNTGIVGIDGGGTYNLSGGDFNATVYFNDEMQATFHQTGGRINQALTIFQGTYLFDGGINYGGIVDPIDNGTASRNGWAQVVQSGGTNFGELDLGGRGTGNYVLSNGCSFLPGLDIGVSGIFHQFGGTQIVTNGLTLDEPIINFDPRGRGYDGGIYFLSGGTLMAGGMALHCFYGQDGGTNLVAGDIYVFNREPITFAGVQLDDGLLAASNMTMWFGTLRENGGRLIINNLAAYGFAPGKLSVFGPEINYTGGQLSVSNITVATANFAISTTNLQQTGTLTLASGMLLPGAGAYTFGPLMVDSYYSGYGGGQSVISLGTNASCQIHFADSSGLNWSNSLTIRNWSGSFYGGGNQQIIFGSNSAALTTQQLGQIFFPNPAGGAYYARILATGEIVPDTGAPLPPMAQLSNNSTNAAMHLTLGGDIGQTYAIDVSTDLVHWNTWTNQFNASGTMTLDDDDATNHAQRFYRAHRVP